MRLASREWSATNSTDAPVALLLHGITGSSGTWWRVGPALSDAGWRVIALDLPGHGDSPRIIHRDAFDEYVRTVVEWASRRLT